MTKGTILRLDPSKQSTCKHEHGFSFISGVCLDIHSHMAVFACNSGCAYWLNFDPKLYPNGIAILSEEEYQEKKKRGKQLP